MSNETGTLKAIAQRYRSDYPGHDDGVVLVWQDEAYGWKNELRDPQSERPGVYAVDAKGNIWKAVGGNDYDGAERWEATPMNRRHVIQTDDSVDAADIKAALEAAGIYAEAQPLHLQAAAKVAAAEIADYPASQQSNARDSLIAWMDELLDAADEARLQRIAKSIAKLKRDHGELATWRCPGGYIALDVPTALITSIANAANDARRDIELRTLTGLLLPQLERIAPSIMQGVLGAEYAGNRGDYERLVAIAVDDLRPR